MFDLPPPSPTIQVELALTGMSKGLAQTEGPQVVLRPGVAFGDFQLEATIKNIESGDEGGVEAQYFAIYPINIGGFELSGRGGRKSVHGIGGSFDRQAFEMRLDAGRKFGPIRATASFTYSPDDTGSTRQSKLFEGNLAWKVRKTTQVSARIGRRERDGSPDYTAFNAGITQDIVKQLAADVRVYDTASSDLGRAYKRRLVASLRAKF